MCVCHTAVCVPAGSDGTCSFSGRCRRGGFSGGDAPLVAVGLALVGLLLALDGGGRLGSNGGGGFCGVWTTIAVRGKWEKRDGGWGARGHCGVVVLWYACGV